MLRQMGDVFPNIVNIFQFLRSSAERTAEVRRPLRSARVRPILEDRMRQRALKVVLVLVGLFFTAAVIPTWNGIRGADPNTGDTMQMAIYATLGVFLLIAARNPAAHRSVIAFAAWSS
jgi:hypothetical protein